MDNISNRSTVSRCATLTELGHLTEHLAEQLAAHLLSEHPTEHLSEHLTEQLTAPLGAHLTDHLTDADPRRGVPRASSFSIAQPPPIITHFLGQGEYRQKKARTEFLCVCVARIMELLRSCGIELLLATGLLHGRFVHSPCSACCPLFLPPCQQPIGRHATGSRTRTFPQVGRDKFRRTDELRTLMHH